MSDSSAIGAVSAVLTGVIREAVAPFFPSPSVTVGTPEALQGNQGDSPRINVFLYATHPNPSMRNFDLPHRDGQGMVIEQPKLALDLHYLLSFYGAESEMQPERLAGATLGALYRDPVMSRTVIEDAVSDILVTDPGSFVAESDLADQFERIHISPIALTIEEISNLWSMFQTPYALSAAIEVSVVIIEPEVEVATGPPVMGRGIFVVPALHPVIDSIEPQTVDASSGEPVVIRGRHLGGDGMVVQVGDLRVDAPAAGPSRLRAQLPTGVTAGVHSVRVIRTLQMGDPPRRRDVTESNTAVVIVRPVVTGAAFAAAPEPTVTVQIDPAVQPEQKVALLISEANPPPGQVPASQKIERTVTAATSSVEFTPVSVPPGDYLLRVRVEEAESVLQLLPDGSLTGPLVTVL